MFFHVEFKDDHTILRLKMNNNVISTLTYRVEKEINAVYFYTIQTTERYKRKGYGTLMMNYFVECFRNYNILVKVIGEKDNIPCMKLLNKHNFEELILINEPFMIRYSDDISNDNDKLEYFQYIKLV